MDYLKYFAKLHEMKKKYASQITVKEGLEFGIQTITLNDYNELYSRYEKELDFTLLSMHQVDNLEFWTHDFMQGRTRRI